MGVHIVMQARRYHGYRLLELTTRQDSLAFKSCDCLMLL